MAGTHTPMNQDIHTHEPRHTHVSRHTYTHSFHYSFPLAVHPVNCYVLHGFTHKLCLVELFFYVFRLQCFHWPNIQPSFSTICILTDVFFTCNWNVCSIHSGIGAWRLWGQRPQQFFQRKAPLPTPTPIGCMCWINVLYVLDYLFLSHSTCHIMTYHASCPIFHYMHPFTHSQTHIYTTLTTTCIPCQSLYMLKL